MAVKMQSPEGIKELVPAEKVAQARTMGYKEIPSLPVIATTPAGRDVYRPPVNVSRSIRTPFGALSTTSTPKETLSPEDIELKGLEVKGKKLEIAKKQKEISSIAGLDLTVDEKNQFTHMENILGKVRALKKDLGTLPQIDNPFEAEAKTRWMEVTRSNPKARMILKDIDSWKALMARLAGEKGMLTKIDVEMNSQLLTMIKYGSKAEKQEAYNKLMFNLENAKDAVMRGATERQNIMSGKTTNKTFTSPVKGITENPIIQELKAKGASPAEINQVKKELGL
jgi:hypothetical protein